MPPRDTIWPMDAHTPGKHQVLRNYLNAWIPILGQTRGRILFVDGFAGPGEYAGGEEGSPLIALRAFHEHPAIERIRAEVVFLFIENHEARAEHLRNLVDARFPARPRTRVHVACADFEPTLEELLDGVEAGGDRLAPAFVMVDPFGVKGFSMNLLGRILRHPSSEVYVTFMWGHVERFYGQPEFAPHLTAIFGDEAWMRARDLPDTETRRRYLFDLYKQRLREAGARDVLHFELFNGGDLVYAIFFATQHRLGTDRMKAAIWKVVPFGDYRFRGIGPDQLGFDLAVTEPVALRTQLRDFARGGWVTIEELEDFVRSDATPFYSGQLRAKTLAPMEREGVIEVQGPVRRRMGHYPPGTRLRFC